MKLFLKLHPSCIAWLCNNEIYGTINLTSNLIENGHIIKGELGSKVDRNKIDNIIIEKPFLKLQGDNQRKLADDIIYVQRNFGMLLYILDLLFPGLNVTHVSSKVARQNVYKREHISKDLQLSEAGVLLKNKEFVQTSPLQVLCLHDCLVLKKYINDKGE